MDETEGIIVIFLILMNSIQIAYFEAEEGCSVMKMLFLKILPY